MLKNIQIIIRRLKRQQLHTISHIIGLTLGIGVCITIGLFLLNELNFDTHHENADRIYRVNQNWDLGSEEELGYTTVGPLAEAIRTEIPSVEEAVLVYPKGEKSIEVIPNTRYLQEGILFTEADFLKIFDVEFIQGNPQEALRQPWETLLTESTAEKFFGQENAIGKTILYDNEQPLTVTGIIKDFPSNTHLPAQMIVSYFPSKDYLGFDPNTWMMTFGASTYVLLKKDTDVATLEASIQAIYDKNFNDKYSEAFSSFTGAVLQPLSAIHFEPQYDGGGSWVTAISPKWLWFFGAVGLIVLLLACINFINLSTAQSLSRSKEVGIRKAIGATRGQLMLQFINEATFLIVCSTVLAVGAIYFVLPFINTQLTKTITLAPLFSPLGLLALFGFIVLTSILTGLYPAWLISKFQPAATIQSDRMTGSSTSSILRKALVTAQFAISGAMLIALLFISQQMHYFYQRDLGFEQNNIISIELPNPDKISVFSNQLADIKGVESYSFNSSTPSVLSRNGTTMHETDYTAENAKEVDLLFADDAYADVFELQLVAGEFYKNADTTAISSSLPADQRFPKVLVNEQLLQTMGFGTPEEALNKRFKIGWMNWQPEIVGVVKNFVTSSLHHAIQPIIIFQAPEFLDAVNLKISDNADVTVTLQEIQRTWESNFPDEVYAHQFLDEQLKSYYESENLLFTFFKIFAGLALLISCIGLWGLATHTALQRTKEIGIRKVLGASVGSVVGLLAKDFIKWVILALLIAIPFTWYFVAQWLDNFVYHIEIKWWIFAIASATIVAIALLTVSFQSIRAALVNPVESLKNE